MALDFGFGACYYEMNRIYQEVIEHYFESRKTRRKQLVENNSPKTTRRKYSAENSSKSNSPKILRRKSRRKNRK